jgi:hypothetical protein
MSRDIADFAYETWVRDRPRLQLTTSHHKEKTRPNVVDSVEYAAALERAREVLEAVLRRAPKSRRPRFRATSETEMKEEKRGDGTGSREISLSWTWADPTTSHHDTTIKIELQHLDGVTSGSSGTLHTPTNYCKMFSASPNLHESALLNRLRRDVEYAEFDFDDTPWKGDCATLYWPNGIALDTVLRELVRVLFGAIHNLAKSKKRLFQPFVAPVYGYKPSRHQLKQDELDLAANAFPLFILDTLNAPSPPAASEVATPSAE